MKRFQKMVGWLVVSLLILGLSPWWLNKIMQMIVTQPDNGELADAIVVLGRGRDSTEYRTAAAVQLWQQGRAPHIFMSGANDAPILMTLAQEMGVPDRHVSGEGCSNTTWRNAFFTELLIPVNGSSSAKPKILLVTDDLHIARSTIIYRNFGFDVIPYPVRMQFPIWRRQVFREFAAFMIYIKTKRLLPPTPADYKREQSYADSRIAEWQCVYTDAVEVTEK